MAGYRIADEPTASGLSAWAVDPVWPLFALMFSGMWLAWPWHVFNAFATGSPTRLREALLAGLGFLAHTVCIVALLALVGTETLPVGAIPYVMIGLTVLKLGIGYWLYVLQQRSFPLYQYFGGNVRNGMLVVGVGFVLRAAIPWPGLLMLFVG